MARSRDRAGWRGGVQASACARGRLRDPPVGLQRRRPLLARPPRRRCSAPAVATSREPRPRIGSSRRDSALRRTTPRIAACSPASIWNHWIAVGLAIGVVLAIIGLIVGYLRSVVRPKYPPRRRAGLTRIGAMAPARSTGTSPSGSPSASPAATPSPLVPLRLAGRRLRRADRAGRGAGRRGHRAAQPRRPGPGPGRPTAPDWVRANIASFQRLLRPLTDRLERQDRLGGSPRRSPAGSPAPRSGALLGWMSTRVLGQYDLLVIEDEDPEEQDLVYYVGPNVLALEKRFAFPPREFRLWLALHEVTHRAQFTGIPWMREHFLGLVDGMLVGRRPRPASGSSTPLGRAAERDPRGHATRSTTAASSRCSPRPSSGTLLEQIGGLMSLLEGHGDVTMDRAGADQIPNAERFGQVLRQRRQQANPADQAAPAAHRARGQAEAVRAGRAVHRGGRGRRRHRRCSTGRGRTPANLPTLARDPRPASALDRTGSRAVGLRLA